MDVSNISIPGFENIAVRDEIARKKLGNIVYVSDFGAKGDGVTDDTQSIQNAINNTKNGTLHFGPGNYMITSPVNLPEKCFVLLYNELLSHTNYRNPLPTDTIPQVYAGGGHDR